MSKNDDNDQNSLGLPWWTLDEPGPTLVEHVDRLQVQDRSRLATYRLLTSLYDGQWPSNLGLDLQAVGHMLDGDSNTDMNYAKRAIDFVHNRCTSETPGVRAEGHGADLDQHNRAEELTKFIEGLTKALRLDVQMPRSMLSCLKTGMGCVLVTRDEGKVGIEVCSPREFFVSRADGRYGNPRSLYRSRAEDRRTLMLRHPDQAEAIWDAPSSSTKNSAETYAPTNYGSGGGVDEDSVDVIYAWNLPWNADTEEEVPGRYVKCLASAVVLEDAPWSVPRFPVSFLPFQVSDPGSGFWPLGLMQALRGLQVAIYDHASHIQEAFQHSNLKIFLPGTKTVPDYMTSPEMGTYIPVPDEAGVPVAVAWNPVAPQEIEWFQYLVEQLYALAGMSQDNAKGGTPAGMDSGRAQLINFNINSSNWVDLIRRYGAHVVEVVDRLIDAAKMLASGGDADAETKSGITARYSKGSITDVIDWTDVDMDRDEFVIELEEVSAVADTPAGRLQQLEQDVAGGVLPPEQLAYARQDPDAWWERTQSSRSDIDYVRYLVKQCNRPDRPMPRVIEEMNRPLAVDMFRREIQQAVISDRPPEVIERLQEVSSQIVASLKRDAEQAAAQQQAPGQPQPQQPAPAPAVAPSNLNTL